MTRTKTKTSAFENAVEGVRRGETVESQAELLMAEMTSDEKLWLLDGDTEFWPGIFDLMDSYNDSPMVLGALPRLGIPGLRFSDGPRGVVMGRATAFPVSIARGATWDVALEQRVGEAMGAEARALGANFFAGVCINLLRHPAWGRAQETYGEEPVHLGALGGGLIRGLREHVMPVVKHYALNSIENTRYRLNVTADEATMREVYLPHFREAMEAGAEGVMSAYNAVNGSWAGQSETLLTRILRDDWGFDGITVSDFIFGLRDAAESLRAGLDVEAPFRQQRAQDLPRALEAGAVSWDLVDRSVRRIIATQLGFHSRLEGDGPGLDVVFSSGHRQLAREVAETAAVLLKNEPVSGRPVLPLQEVDVQRIALIGRLANRSNTGDEGSSSVRSPHVCTALEGIGERWPGAEVNLVEEDDPDAAHAAARAADVAIVIVGYTAEDEGEHLDPAEMDTAVLNALFPPRPDGTTTSPFEGRSDGFLMGGAAGGDRKSLRLRPSDVDLIRASAAGNPRTIVVMVAAGAVIVEEWRDDVPAILIGWYSGSEGGTALARVLAGDTDAAGRLPFAVPAEEAHLPAFDREATEVRYDRWHGQRLLDREALPAAFPLGFGLSYTTFDLSQLSVEAVAEESSEVEVTVTNTGERRGRHVVQIYGTAVDAVDFPTSVLLGFAPVWLGPGEAQRVRVSASLRPLKRWTDGGFEYASTWADISAAPFSGAEGVPVARVPLTS